jgi:hypothetical protein
MNPNPNQLKPLTVADIRPPNKRLQALLEDSMRHDLFDPQTGELLRMGPPPRDWGLAWWVTRVRRGMG